MPTVVVFDCESDSKPTRSGPRGELEFRQVQCTVACALVLDTSTLSIDQAREITCWRDVAPTKGANPFKELLDAFDSADVIVGYNSLDFDMPLLWKHYGTKAARRYLEHRIKSIDIFSRIRAVTSQWPKLDDLLAANKLGSKSGNGAHAITLWEEQRRDELQQYCMMDVRKTAELALLPRMRMGDAWVPNHVYGPGPAIQAIRVLEPIDTKRAASPVPTPSRERSESDSEFVVVNHPAKLS